MCITSKVPSNFPPHLFYSRDKPTLSSYSDTSVAAADSWAVTTENSPVRFRMEEKLFKDKQQET